jgi:hypothetical protein
VKLRGDERGSALVTVFMVTMVLILLGIGLLQYVGAAYGQVINTEARAKAYYIARSGAEAIVSYIANDPKGLGPEKMDSLVEDALKASPSLPRELGDGSFRVRLTREAPSGGGHGKLLVTVTGTVRGVSETVMHEMRYVPGRSGMAPIDNAVFAMEKLEMKNSAEIRGDAATNSISSDAVQLRNSAKITGTLWLGPDADPTEVVDSKDELDEHVAGGVQALSEVRDYTLPPPEFPLTPSLPKRGSLSRKDNHHIYEDGSYDSITVGNSKTLTIHVDAGETRRISVGTLALENSGKLIISGGGKVILYVSEELVLDNSSTMNKQAGGTTDGLELYYAGSKDVELKNSSKINGSVYAKHANVILHNSTEITGFLITGGDSVEFKNSSEMTIGLVYAPKSDIQLKNSAKVTGAIVGKTIAMDNSSQVTWRDLGESGIGFEATVKKPPSYALGIWK